MTGPSDPSMHFRVGFDSVPRVSRVPDLAGGKIEISASERCKVAITSLSGNRFKSVDQIAEALPRILPFFEAHLKTEALPVLAEKFGKAWVLAALKLENSLQCFKAWYAEEQLLFQHLDFRHPTPLQKSFIEHAATLVRDNVLAIDTANQEFLNVMKALDGSQATGMIGERPSANSELYKRLAGYRKLIDAKLLGRPFDLAQEVESVLGAECSGTAPLPVLDNLYKEVAEMQKVTGDLKKIDETLKSISWSTSNDQPLVYKMKLGRLEIPFKIRHSILQAMVELI